MPRFIVTLCDVNSHEISSHISRIEKATDAICNHPWLTYVYRSEWIAAHIYGDDEEETFDNLKESCGWIGTCVNLDEEILKDMNSVNGDKSVNFSVSNQNQVS